MESQYIDYGALTHLQRTIGFLVALASAVVSAWVVGKKQHVVPKQSFSQARNIAIIGTAVFISIMFAFSADSNHLVALGMMSTMGVFGCLVFFLWNVWCAVVTGENHPGRIVTYLATFILYVISGTVGLSAAGLLLYVVQTNPENSSGKSTHDTQTALPSLAKPTPLAPTNTRPHKEAPRRLDAVPRSNAYPVLVHLTGHRMINAPGEVIPFRASSGQVNFGCEQVLSARANWAGPEGSTIVGAVEAQWTNVDNARAYEASARTEGHNAIGEGTISGLELQRLPFGITNCPGGGHGEIVVSGHYRTTAVTIQPYETDLRGRVQSSPPAARTARFTLPTPEDITLDQAILTCGGPEFVDRALLNLRTNQVGKRVISERGICEGRIDGAYLIVTFKGRIHK